MELSLILPEKHGFDPGDGHQMGLSLQCFNSVDGSSRLCAVLRWFRFVCSNGLILGTTLLNVRQIHNGRININELGAPLMPSRRNKKGVMPQCSEEPPLF